MAKRNRQKKSIDTLARPSTLHGVGWDALAAAVILYAVRDAAKATRPGERADALAFLCSSACDDLLHSLDMPSNTVLLDRLRDGVPANLIDQIAGSAHDPDARNERQRRYRARQRYLESLSLNLVLC